MMMEEIGKLHSKTMTGMDAKNDEVITGTQLGAQVTASSKVQRTKQCPDADSIGNILAEIGSDKLNKKTKSVSFHSATSMTTERKIASASDCLQYMISGSNLTKIRSNSRQYNRFFTLTEDCTTIRWTPTSKKSNKAFFSVSSIREIRSGKFADVFRNKELSMGYSPDCTFSIIYGNSFETLNLVSSTPEECNIWVTGLNALIVSEMSGSCVHLRDKWLFDMFNEADTEKLGCLTEEEAIALVLKLNNRLTASHVHQKITEMGLVKTEVFRGKVECEEFIEMFKKIATRPEIYFLMIRYFNKEFLTVEDLHSFLEAEQGVTGLLPEHCRKIIEQFEPSEDGRRSYQLHIDGFNQFLMSGECDIFDSTHRRVCQDMTQPLAHYFISTSHNTYLLEDQLKGPSSVDGYIWALSNGCRCIKIDCWDGADGPVIYHGHTLTGKVYFCDVVAVIKEYAFKYSRFPLIIHLENHCNLKNQHIMAFQLKSVLGHMLYTQPRGGVGERTVCEMSPTEIGSQIILKGRRLPVTCKDDEGDVSEENEDSENNNTKLKSIAQHSKFRLCRDLSDLISINRTKFRSFRVAREQKDGVEAYSVSESTAAKLVHACPEEMTNHNKHFLMRVFPNGSRIDSSNFNPQDFWNCGCQMVALNFQTPGQMLDLYNGRFCENGGCGYVLKPSVMREPVPFYAASCKGCALGFTPQLLCLKIISGQQLPRPKGSKAKGESIDPYVVVQIFGIPSDCAEVQTRTVSNEGNNPIFDESFEFQISFPELVLIRFVVLDDDYIGDDFIGQFTISFNCLRTGYRHIHLLSSTGAPLENNCTLFVHVAKMNIQRGGKLKRENPNIRVIGVKPIDDIIKSIYPNIREASAMRMAVDLAMTGLQEEYGLNATANIKQCLRILLTRVAVASDGVSLTVVKSSGFPELQVEGSLPQHMSKAVALFNKVLLEIREVLDKSDTFLSTFNKTYGALLEHNEDLETFCVQAGLKGKKMNKAIDTYAWNMQILRGQIDLLNCCFKQCKQAVAQMQTFADSQLSEFTKNKDSSPVIARDCCRMTLHSKGQISDYTSTIPHSPTSPLEGQPKGILKKKGPLSDTLPENYFDLEPS